MIRLPLVEDEIQRDMTIARLSMSDDAQERLLAASGAFAMLVLIARITVNLGTIPQVTTEHLRGLRRDDFNRLVEAMNALETADMAQAENEGNGPG